MKKRLKAFLYAILVLLSVALIEGIVTEGLVRMVCPRNIAMQSNIIKQRTII